MKERGILLIIFYESINWIFSPTLYVLALQAASRAEIIHLCHQRQVQISQVPPHDTLLSASSQCKLRLYWQYHSRVWFFSVVLYWFGHPVSNNTVLHQS